MVLDERDGGHLLAELFQDDEGVDDLKMGGKGRYFGRWTGKQCFGTFLFVLNGEHQQNHGSNSISSAPPPAQSITITPTTTSNKHQH